MSDERFRELLASLEEGYNPPPLVPREEMWAAIQARLEAREEGVVSLPSDRSSPVSSRTLWRLRPLAWASAAAAVLVLGVGIGRMTAPGAGPEPGSMAGLTQTPDLLRFAAVEHLVLTESLLTLMQADARTGRMGPEVGGWARDLLSETRLLLDAYGEADPVMKELFEDLELVLAQIVGAASAEKESDDRGRSELRLAMEGLEMKDVLPRIQAALPAEPGFAGN